MEFDLAGIGNALMDALVVVPDDTLIDDLGLTRGTMHPVEDAQWQSVYAKVRHLDVVLHSGGSCANTVATAGRLGARAIYRGQVGDDELGRQYGASLENSCGGHALRVTTEAATGKCLSLISQRDAERTMLTDLGAAVSLPDLGEFERALSSCRIAHFEGYTLLDGPMCDMILEAMALAKSSGALVSLDAADPFVTATIPERFRKACVDHADIVFLNADEARAVGGVDDPVAACRKVSEECGIAHVAVKLGARGSVVAHDGQLVEIPVFEVDAVDTTGAGDAYAGGYLVGLSKGWSVDRAGRLASQVAALTVSQMGAVVHDAQALSQALTSA
ncbi:MAG: adenosine kinase [Myxococcales bacterium]|nr:adenosine kinase [Myxococcales bacterium]